ncbi:MAG: SDR family NAD(P)-dependent oxidoreductase, partial [Proteobacteria bacterium]|nr:SDR family NAD(P)-dependent oxidoreductase [Pseudomonadota bacterium]
MQGKTCLVTGANTGIGKETARELAARGAQVIMVCRNREKGEAALGDIVETTGNENVVLLLADLASLEQVRSLGAQVNRDYPRLDVLINNAGLQLWDRHVTPDGYEETFAVNHLAPFLLTHLLLPSLQAAGTARIVNVSSGMHWGGRIHLNDLMRERRYSSSRVYAQTKLANVLFTYELARRLEGSG